MKSFDSLTIDSRHLVSKGNLEHLQITDEILMALMDYPVEAFEIYFDPNTNAECIRIKSAYRARKNKIKAKKPKKKTKSKSLDYPSKCSLCSGIDPSDYHVGGDLSRRSRTCDQPANSRICLSIQS